VVAVGDVPDADEERAAIALLVLVGIALEDVVLELVDQAAMLLVDRGRVFGHVQRVAKCPAATIAAIMVAMYDVVVAGGGPAGLSAARTAAEAGARVILLERDSAFGIPTRTSGGSFISDLRALGIPEHLYNPLHEVRFVGPDSEAVIPFTQPEVCILDVRALYQWLAERAAGAGVDLHLRATVMRAQAGDDGVVVGARGPGGEWRTVGRYAVDATGTQAVLATAIGMHPPFARRAVGAELDMSAPAFPTSTCWLIVGEQIAPAGYAWAFPYRAGRVRLGVGVMRPDSNADPRELLERVRRLDSLRAALDGAQPLEVHAGLIPVEPLRTSILRDRVLTVGDSASHASTLVGEGIRYAIAAGEACGAALGEAVRLGDDAPLRRFERSWRERHHRDFRVAYRINRALAGFDDARWDRSVRALATAPRWFVVAALRTDFRPRHIARLAVAHPRLTARFVRAALS
jgi:digeranylgeranylglycerophospholipid reductase